MPPLEPMTGFGKYRRSIHAHPEWQMEQYRTNLRDFPGLVSQLGEFKLADPDPVVWNQFRQESARSDSFASSNASHSNSSECPTDGNTDHRDGPIITRGFDPSTNSSSSSSSRSSSSGHVRKDSGTLMTSASEDNDNELARFPSRQSTLSLLCEPTVLPTINEDLAGDHNQCRKVSQFLKVATGGDVDNVFESDNEDESEDSFKQPEQAKCGTHSTGPLTLRPSSALDTKLAQKAIPKRVTGQDSGQKRPPHSKSRLDRSTTVIRKPVKLPLRRTTSRGKPPTSKRAVVLENAPIAGRKFTSAASKPQGLVSHASPSPDESMETPETLGDLGLCMAGPRNSTYQVEEKEDLTGSFASDSTMHNVTTSILSGLSTKSTMRPPQNGSGTVMCNLRETAHL